MEDELILSEEDKLKLDEIVSQMIQNNEPDESIQFVVEDFKSIYGVKKKDSDLPVQEEVTESITEVETPDTSLVSSESLIVEEEPSQEKDTLIERTFGKNVITDFLGDLYRSATQGLGQAQTVDDALEIFAKGSTATDEDLADYIKAIQESESYQETDEMRDFYKTYQEEGEGLFGVLKGIGENPSILPQILTSSIFSMFNPAVAAGAGAGAGAGALTGAAAGAIGGPLAAITAGGGAVAGMIGGATTTLETALTFNELLKEELGGLPFTKENVRAVLNDPEKLSRLRNRAAGRGAAIGTVDAITGGLAGKATTAVLGKTARKVTQAGAKKLGQGSRLAATGTGLGVEAVGGSLGEVAGKAVAGQEMDVADIALEGVAGLGSAPITLGRSLFSNQPIYTINGVEKTKQEMQGIIKDMTDEDISSSKAKIIINNDPVTYNLLKDKLDNYVAIQEQKTGDILDAEPAESVQEVEAEVREPAVETEEKVEEPIIETSKENIVIYKGLEGKRDAEGNLITRHPGAKGSFFSPDRSIAEEYKGEGEMLEEVIPAGTSIETVEINQEGLSVDEYNQAEEDAINASEADVVKLITLENKLRQGDKKEVQYVVKKELPKIPVKPEEGLKDVFLSTGKIIKDNIRSINRRLFTARRFLPKVFYDVIKNKDAQIQGDMDAVANLNRDYNKIIKSVKDPNERENLEKLSDQLLRGEEVEIREDLKEVITSMRNMIDDLSRKLLLDPTINAETKSKIKNNLGSYLTRSYQKFDSKNWKTKISDDVISAASSLLYERYKQEDPNLTEEQILKKIDKQINKTLKGKAGTNWIFKKEISGKDIAAMKSKQDIPLEIRMLMGEYTDVAQNFAKTIIKLSSQTNTSQMLRDIRAIGLQTGILKKNDDTPGFSEKIAPTESKAFKEIAGLYTTPEIAEEFNRMVDQKPKPALLDAYFALVATNKYFKTILSPATHAVNFVSNMGFAAVNGYGDVRELRNAYQSFRNLSRGKNFNREMYNKYVRLGIIDKSVGLQEVKELFNDSSFENAIIRNIDSKGNNLATKLFKKVKGGVEQAYQAEDDFWKIYSFEHELDRYSNAEYGKKPSDLTESELSKVEKIAAENVKKVMPSYDQIPDVIKKFRSVPIVGSFVSFQYESYRTALNTIKLAQKELASENPKLRKAGAKRLVGSMTYIAGRNALLASYGKMAGLGVAGIIGSALSDDDEKDRKSLAKRYLMEWQKESDILPLNIKDGKFKIIDISGSDPHGAINKTINAMSEAESPEDAALKLFVESVYKPFAGGDMTANLLLELKENKKPSGAPIWNKEDLGETKFIKGALYAASKLQPGVTKQIGQVLESENKLKRIGSMATGLKEYEFDIPKAFKYKTQAFSYGRKLPNIKKAYKKNIKDKSPEEIDRIYEDYNKNYTDAIKNMHLDYRAARDVFGISNKELVNIMKESGVSDKIIVQIINNKPINLPKDPDAKTTSISSSAIRAF